MHFVYRSHYEGPLSRRVIAVDAPDLLTFFAGLFDRARGAADPGDAYQAMLDGYVYGFGTMCEAVKEHDLPNPTSIAALRDMLAAHLYVEGGDPIVDDHTIRVATNDDEVELAYFLFDDVAAARRDRTAFLLVTDPKLPDGARDRSFVPPVEVDTLAVANEPPRGAGTTFACLLTFEDGETLPGSTWQLPGVRLPELAATLRATVPASRPQSWSADWLATWPLELRVLRALVDRDDSSIGPALQRASTVPMFALVNDAVGVENHTHVGIGPHTTARAELAAATAGLRHAGDPAKSLVHAGEHVAVACMHAHRTFGYQQWILFDDLWAGAQPELAASLLRYATTWDPFE